MACESARGATTEREAERGAPSEKNQLKNSARKRERVPCLRRQWEGRRTSTVCSERIYECVVPPTSCRESGTNVVHPPRGNRSCTRTNSAIHTNHTTHRSHSRESLRNAPVQGRAFSLSARRLMQPRQLHSGIRPSERQQGLGGGVATKSEPVSQMKWAPLPLIHTTFFFPTHLHHPSSSPA